jgi:hypothetical protein
MRPGPSKKMEAAAAFLIPPACREEVLGDLCERYKSGPQYIVDVVRTLPLVIWSQVRRTTEPRVFLLEALAVYLSFLGAQWLVIGPSGFLLLAIPSVTTLIGLRLAAVYSTRPWTPLLAVAFAFLFQVGLPLSTMIFGGALAVLLLSVVPRPSDNLRATASTGGQITPLDDIRRKALEFQVKISRRNLREYIVAAFVFVSVSSNFSREPVSKGLIIAGVAYMVYHLYSRGSARTAPPDADFATYRNFHRTELERQRDLLRAVWSWYLGPLIPGLLVFAVRDAMTNPRPWIGLYAVLVLLFFLGVAKLNRDAARKLQRQIDDLDAMEAQQ